MNAWRYENLLVFKLISHSFEDSLVRYQFEHSKINFISPRAHVLFSIYIYIVCIMYST